MKIKTLRLDNFQGIPHAEFDFEGLSASIYGDNATGKTTVFNAVCWLLFDKSSTGAKNFTPKTQGPNGDVHNLDHSAEASFIMPTGEIATFKKVYHEVWKKKRGSTATEFDGHTIDYFIDGVPVKEKQYTGTLQNYCGGIERMKILTMPDYFSEVMPWDERRKILIELCGDVTDTDVIRSSPELVDLEDFLRKPGTTNQSYSVEEYKRIASARKSEINKQLQSLPGRIDEARRAMPEPDTTILQISADIYQRQDLRKEFMERRASLVAGGGAVAEARRRTAEAETTLSLAKSAYLSKAGEVNTETLNEIGKQTMELGKTKDRVSDLRLEAKRLRQFAERMVAQRQELIQEYGEIQAKTWDEAQETCPTCGQRLPADQIDSMKAAFNKRRSEQLTAINEKGKAECSVTMIETTTAQAEEADRQANAADMDVILIQERIDSLQTKLTQPPAFETTPEYFDLSAKLSICRAAEREAEKASAPDTSSLDAELRQVEAELAELQRKKARIEQAEAQKVRIAELEAQEKQMGAEYENLERGVWLCDEFTKAKVRMLTSRIDSRFHNVRFRLFQEQLNGGVKDDCEVLIPGEGGRMVPYSFANNAARINAGLEIIGILADFWNMEMPVFIDNAESVTHLVRAWTQTIRLVVSEQDKQLRLALD